MFTILMGCIFFAIAGTALLLDDAPGNDGIGEFFVGAGTMGTLVISGIMLWSTV